MTLKSLEPFAPRATYTMYADYLPSRRNAACVRWPPSCRKPRASAGGWHRLSGTRRQGGHGGLSQGRESVRLQLVAPPRQPRVGACAHASARHRSKLPCRETSGKKEWRLRAIAWAAPKRPVARGRPEPFNGDAGSRRGLPAGLRSSDGLGITAVSLQTNAPALAPRWRARRPGPHQLRCQCQRRRQGRCQYSRAGGQAQLQNAKRW